MKNQKKTPPSTHRRLLIQEIESLKMYVDTLNTKLDKDNLKEFIRLLIFWQENRAKFSIQLENTFKIITQSDLYRKDAEYIDFFYLFLMRANNCMERLKISPIE